MPDKRRKSYNPGSSFTEDDFFEPSESYYSNSYDDIWRERSETYSFADEYRRPAPRRKVRIRRIRVLPLVICAVLFIKYTCIVAGIIVFESHSRSYSASSVENPNITAPPVSAPPSEPAQPPPDPVVLVSGKWPAELLYFRSLLSDTEKDTYDIISAGIEARAELIGPFKIPDESQLNLLCEYVFADHPEYFWFSGAHTYSYFEVGGGFIVELSPEYTLSPQQIAEIEQSLAQLSLYFYEQLASLPEYNQLKGIYDYLINNTVYDLSFSADQSLASVVNDGRGVCAGYSRYIQYFLLNMGIPAIYITGEAKGENHAWNIVMIEGEYYHLDATWGDPFNEDGIQTLEYTYFCLSDEEIYRDHSPYPFITYPECNSTSCNYYVREGRYLTEYDESLLKSVFSQGLDERGIIDFRLSDYRIYSMYMQLLFDNDCAGAFRIIEQTIIPDVDYISWGSDDVMYIISIQPGY